MIAVDFSTVETVWLQRLYVLFFIELGSRHVHLAGCTPNPNSAWMTQQARQLVWTLSERSTPLRFLIPDRQQVHSYFDTVFRSEGIETIRTPVRAPKANAVAGASSLPSGRVSRLAPHRQPAGERVLRVFVQHYNGHRPHRSLNFAPPDPQQPTLRLVTSPRPGHVERRDRLGGLIHEYSLAAWEPGFRTPQATAYRER
jgi:putative transposase